MRMTMPSVSEIAQASSFLTLIGNGKRMLILDIVSRNETSVGKLALMVGLRQSALSQHLTILKNAHLVQTRRDAQTIYYRSESASVASILTVIHEIFNIDVPASQDVDGVDESVVVELLRQ